GLAASVAPRVAQLVDRMRASATRPILVGSSMGAFTCALASLRAPCAGLFLLALPAAIPGQDEQLDMAEVPAMLIHGFADMVCPWETAVAFARRRHVPAVLLADGHRLAEHVDAVCAQFRLFMERLES